MLVPGDRIVAMAGMTESMQCRRVCLRALHHRGVVVQPVMLGGEAVVPRLGSLLGGHERCIARIALQRIVRVAEVRVGGVDSGAELGHSTDLGRMIGLTPTGLVVDGDRAATATIARHDRTVGSLAVPVALDGRRNVLGGDDGRLIDR